MYKSQGGLITRAAPSTSSILKITGAAGNDKPVGIIIPPEFADKVSLSTSTVTADGAWQIELQEILPENSGGGGILKRTITGESIERTHPESCTLTLVTTNADGSYKYNEWTLVLDIISNTDKLTSNFPVVEMIGEDGTSTTVTNMSSTPIYLPPFAPVLEGNNALIGIQPKNNYLSVSTDEPYGYVTSFYVTDDWLTFSTTMLIRMSQPPRYAYANTDNLTGKERRTRFVTRRAVITTDTVIEERHYTVIQQPVLPEHEAQMAASATVRLESGHSLDELYMRDNIIHVKYGMGSSGGGSMRDLQPVTVAMNPFSVITPGGKPVIINLPDVDWISASSSFLPSGLIEGSGEMGKEEVPDGFFRQLQLESNKTKQERKATFDIVTIVNGKRVATTYTVIQAPDRDTDHGTEM